MPTCRAIAPGRPDCATDRPRSASGRRGRRERAREGSQLWRGGPACVIRMTDAGRARLLTLPTGHCCCRNGGWLPSRCGCGVVPAPCQEVSRTTSAGVARNQCGTAAVACERCVSASDAASCCRAEDARRSQEQRWEWCQWGPEQGTTTTNAVSLLVSASTIPIAADERRYTYLESDLLRVPTRQIGVRSNAKEG
jgi:hypothetical protein